MSTTEARQSPAEMRSVLADCRNRINEPVASLTAPGAITPTVA